MEAADRRRVPFLLMLTLCMGLGWVACQREDPALPLQAIGFDGKTAIIIPSGKLSIKFNQRVTWQISAGTATQDARDSLIYMAANSVGRQQITVKSQRNANDSMVINVITTPRAEVFRPLQKGGYVLVFRHAAADVGVDQAGSAEFNWWQSCDSKLARQLNDQGKKDAVDIGKAFKNVQIPVGKLFSSEYCRCYTTANLMDLGVTVQQAKELTYYVYDEAKRYENTMKLVDSQIIDAKNTVIVGHTGFSGTLPSPAPLSSLNWGDAAVFQLVAGQPARYVATIRVAEWTALAP
ncbi:histidine phosphatase family protein [Runella slithyformis]|uniref:Phosphoglycerate mutase n=1 Tax=Runella slithyformis (strain ATCC 29530 / DSM 19594 / LMG 11500 / NCIMB 11436 / LSU 4) TaxID=761193 RepID=A0A7U3ZR28_RUNSL|nr:histidine phosphatase family protein [Runella slithyformis]AEI51812.1 Phosphoglycerate mutase [Runella slithyformis DSM 19594]